MKKKKAKSKRTPLPLVLIQIVIPLALVVLFLVVGWRIIMPSGDKPQETTAPSASTVPTTEPTEPTPTEMEPESLLPPNRYGPNDFQYYGDYLRCIAGESVMGIDVSRYQGKIDWEAVRDAGVEFAIIRVGYRGSESGLINADAYAQQNLKGAAEAGLDIGVYFFSQAISPEEAEEEAYFLLNAIKDYRITMPVVYDWESVSDPNARTADMDRETLTKCCKTFLETVETAGYRAMLYFNRRQAKLHMDISALKEYEFWLAAYTDRMEFPYRIDMWQYTNSGRVPGIVGDVDINVYFPKNPDV
jgi:GH25 family lysozyme M1 (1,4-beta-N-acetylmuramidase)